ncbi:fructose PTS transporter subunit IIB, partial [Moraxella lacunata]
MTNKTYAISVVDDSAYGLLIAKQLVASLQKNGIDAQFITDKNTAHGVSVVITDDERASTEQVIYLNQHELDSAKFGDVDYLKTLLTPNQTDQAVLKSATSSVRNIVAVTACPTGVAHTFMSAEAIENYAKAQGWNIKVETRGQVGVGNAITADEVAQADLVFVAADIDVDLSKFSGKKMYRTSTGLALKKTEQEFAKAFEHASVYGGTQSASTAGESDEKKGLY